MTASASKIPPLRALLALRAVARHARLADAAAALGVTESAVSHQIRGLEARLGLSLFDRTGGRLALSEAGRRYLARVSPALDEIEAATAALMPAPGRSGVRLTLPPSLAATWLIPRLGGFEAAHPEIDLQLVPTTRLVDLARDQVDLAIRYGRGDWPGLEASHLLDDLAVPVAAPGVIGEAAAPLSALPAGLRYVVNRSIPGEWQEWASARGLAPPPLEDAIELETIEQVLSVAEAGRGIAIGRSPHVEPRLADGRLVAPFGRTGPSTAAYFLCRPAAKAPSAGARKLSRWLAGIAASGRKT